jgi:hypothetical protein
MVFPARKPQRSLSIACPDSRVCPCAQEYLDGLAEAARGMDLSIPRRRSISGTS